MSNITDTFKPEDQLDEGIRAGGDNLSELIERIQNLEQDIIDHNEGFLGINRTLDYLIYDLNLTHDRINSLLNRTDPDNIDDLIKNSNNINLNVSLSIDNPKYFDFLDDLHDLKAKYDL